MIKLLTTDQVLEKVPFGRTWLDERVADGDFPKPRYKWRKNLWLESVIDEWILKNFGDHPISQPISEEQPDAH